MSGKHWLMLRWIADNLRATVEKDGERATVLHLPDGREIRMAVASDSGTHVWVIQINRGVIELGGAYSDLDACVHDLLTHLQEDVLCSELLP